MFLFLVIKECQEHVVFFPLLSSGLFLEILIVCCCCCLFVCLLLFCFVVFLFLFLYFFCFVFFFFFFFFFLYVIGALNDIKRLDSYNDLLITLILNTND